MEPDGSLPHSQSASLANTIKIMNASQETDKVARDSGAVYISIFWIINFLLL
jgi:hypothetical protein